jgi:ubiquinone/menaquinone biosynthesis C-methylase UbiE
MPDDPDRQRMPILTPARSDEPAGAPAQPRETTPSRSPSTGAPRRRRRLVARRLSLSQVITVTGERLLWNRRAANWDSEGSSGLTEVVQAVLDSCQPPPDATALDLGAGSGQVTLPLARRCARVLAVDVSASLLDQLNDKAAAAGISNIETTVGAIEALDLAPESVDLIVSNYTLHHLRDADKQRLMQRSCVWLRPGGQLVIGDMMFGRGASAGDRQIIAGKALSFLRRGPAGWWRLAKNIWRFTLRIREKPLGADAWEHLAREAGFEPVTLRRIVSEACVLSAHKPVDVRRRSAGQGRH